MAKETSLFEKFKETGKHGAIFGIGSTIHKSIAIILIPIYTTHFMTIDYGRLGLIRITAQLFTAIFGLGIVSALFRSYYDYKDEENRSKVISTAFFLLLISCGIFFISGLVFSKHLSVLIFNDSKYDTYFLIVIISSVFSILNAIPFAVFRARMKSVKYIVLQITFLVIGISFIIYLVVLQNWGIKGALVGMLIMQSISLIILYWFIKNDIRFAFSKYEAKKMILFGLPLVPANLAGFVFNSSDRFILNHYSTLHEVGLYNLSYQFGMILMVIFVSPIRLIWGPIFLSHKDDKNAKDFYSKALTYVIFLGAFLFLGLSLLSKEVIQIFSNKEYWAAYKVVPLLVLTYLFWSVENILNVGIGLKRKTKVVAIYFFVGAITNLILNFILIPNYGMMGAAVSTLISFIIMIIIVYFYNRTLIKIKYEWDRITKIILITTIIFSLAFFISMKQIIISVLLKLFLIFLYPVLLYFIKFFSEKELSIIYKLRKKLIHI